MPLPSKTPITQISLGNVVDPSTANQPHLDLESNIDDILSYVTSSALGFFEYDVDNSSGLTFHYRAGYVRRLSGVTFVPAGTQSLTNNATNYVEYNPSTNNVTNNQTGFTAGSIPLWTVTTSGGVITNAADQRSALQSPRSEHHNVIPNNGVTSTNVQAALEELSLRLVNVNGDTMQGNLDFAGNLAIFGNWRVRRESGTGDLIFGVSGQGGEAFRLVQGSGGDYQNSILRIGSYAVWHGGNDGPGSGLNADLLDGNHASYFASGGDLASHTSNTNNPHSVTKAQVGLSNVPNVLPWHAGNDGPGSGLDADTVDGLHGAYLRNAGNMNAGILPAARLSGTYGINISGNASSANTLANARTISLTGDAAGSTTFNGGSNATISVSVNDDSHNHTRLEAVTDNDVKPNATPLGHVSAYRAILSGLTGTPSGTNYQDVLVMNTDQGGAQNANALVFDKDQMVIRHYQADNGAATWGSFRTVAYFEDVWHSGNQGSGTGMDADLLDGRHASYFATATSFNSHASDTTNPHNVTKAQVGLSNVPNVVPWHAGNDGPGSGLNADLLDGRHSGNVSGNIPINNGAEMTDLNANLLQGRPADSFLQTSQNTINMNAYHQDNSLELTQVNDLGSWGSRQLGGMMSFQRAWVDANSYVDLYITSTSVYESIPVVVCGLNMLSGNTWNNTISAPAAYVYRSGTGWFVRLINNEVDAGNYITAIIIGRHA